MSAIGAFLAPMLPKLLEAAGVLVLAGIAWLTTKVKGSIAEGNAWRKVAELSVTFADRTWFKLNPVLQRALADGQFSEAEKAEIEMVLVTSLTEEDRAILEELGKALKIPFASIVARIVANIVNTWVSHHDPEVASLSANTFPVGEVSGG